VLVGRPDLRLRKLDVADRIRAVNVFGAADIAMNERAPDAFRHGNVGPAQKLQHAQRVVRGDRSVGVAKGCGESLEFHAWPADGVENRHGIVAAGVDIDDHSARAAHVEVLVTLAQSSGLERASADLWHRRCQSNGSALKRNMLAESKLRLGHKSVQLGQCGRASPLVDVPGAETSLMITRLAICFWGFNAERDHASEATCPRTAQSVYATRLA